MNNCLKSTCDISISDIAIRNGQHRRKMSEINHRLTQLNKEKTFLINHHKTIATRHFNESNLHPNNRGSQSYLTAMK